jgi:hypothetical protein
MLKHTYNILVYLSSWLVYENLILFQKNYFLMIDKKKFKQPFRNVKTCC